MVRDPTAIGAHRIVLFHPSSVALVYSSPIRLTSPLVLDNGGIPMKYTRDDLDISPPFR